MLASNPPSALKRVVYAEDRLMRPLVAGPHCSLLLFINCDCWAAQGLTWLSREVEGAPLWTWYSPSQQHWPAAPLHTSSPCFSTDGVGVWDVFFPSLPSTAPINTSPWNERNQTTLVCTIRQARLYINGLQAALNIQYSETRWERCNCWEMWLARCLLPHEPPRPERYWL